MGGIAALLPLLMPLISQFLKGKSGDDLAGLLNGNQDYLKNLLNGTSLPAGGQGEGGALSALTLLLPLLMKQNSVVVMSPSNANGNVLIPAGSSTSQLPDPIKLDTIIEKLDLHSERLTAIEKFVKLK